MIYTQNQIVKKMRVNQSTISRGPQYWYDISEELVDPRLSQTLASEIPNGKVLLLPIEGITQEEQKKRIGYIDKMHMNLKNKIRLQM